MIQCSNKYTPWLDTKYRDAAKLRDKLHSEAVRSNDTVKWRQYRIQRNEVNNINKSNKRN